MIKRRRIISPPLISIILFIFPLLIFSQSTIDSINNNYNFDYIKYYYTKTIKDTLNTTIGKINGKIIYSKDSIVLYAISKKQSRYLKFYNNMLIVKENEKSKKIKSIDIPDELNIKKTLNPLIFLKEYKYTIPKNGIIKLTSDKYIFDTLYVYYNRELLLDSIIFFKDKHTILKTLYKKYKNKFPTNIITIDYIRNIKEEMLNYNLLFDTIF